MREIKFRALFRGVWVFFTLDDLIQIDQESKTDEDYAILNHDPRTRGGYTGRKDKNGKEIYEGDIVEEILGGEVTRHIVEWGEVGWLPFCLCEGANIEAGDCRVIGNIHGNPDLLK